MKYYGHQPIRGMFKTSQQKAYREPGLVGSGKEDWHGTLNGYKYHKCRCKRCRRAHAIRMDHYRICQRQKPLTGNEDWHGTIGGVTNHHCTCEDCKEAKRKYYRERKKRRTNG